MYVLNGPHIDVASPDDELTQLLRESLSNKLVLYVEVVSSMGTFISLSELRNRVEVGQV